MGAAIPTVLMRSLHVVVIYCAWTGQQKRPMGVATVTCIGRAIFLVVRWPSGQMTLATVTLEPSYGSQVTQHPHRLTLFVKSQH